MARKTEVASKEGHQNKDSTAPPNSRLNKSAPAKAISGVIAESLKLSEPNPAFRRARAKRHAALGLHYVLRALSLRLF